MEESTTRTGRAGGGPRRHRARLLAGVVALGLLAMGCGGSDGGNAEGASPSTDEQASGSGEPQVGGELVYEFVSEVRSMDPIIAGGSASSGEPPRSLAVYDGLMVVNNETLELEMGMAESITSDDDTVWTMKLRPDITFTDGTPYDAEAVKFNWDRQKASAEGPSVRLMQTVASTVVVDPLTLEITLTEPNALFPRNISAGSINYIASPTAVEAGGADYGSNPVGAGPFILTDWVRDSEMVLERNPDYWDAPRPYLDRVVIKVIVDETQRLNSLNAGEGDATSINAPAVQQQAESSGLELKSINGVSVQSISFNLQRPPFDDIRVRRAIVQAVDPVQLNEVAYEGLGSPATHWFQEGSPFYDADLTYPEYDPEGAQALLDEWAAETGDEVDFHVEFTQSPQNTAINDYLNGVFSKMEHINYTGNFVAVGQLTTDIRARNFSGISYAYIGADPEPNMVETFLSTGARNFFGVSDPDLDEALLAGRSTTDLEERKAAYATAQEILNETVPAILLPRTESAIVYDGDKVQAMPLFEDGGPWFDRIWVRG